MTKLVNNNGGSDVLFFYAPCPRPHLVATAGLDRCVALWDLRMMRQATQPVANPNQTTHFFALLFYTDKGCEGK